MFQFQLVRFQAVVLTAVTVVLSSFNSNWFDYRFLMPGRLTTYLLVSIPTGSITGVLGDRIIHGQNGFNSKRYDYRRIISRSCDDTGKVSIPNGTITGLQEIVARELAKRFQFQTVRLQGLPLTKAPLATSSFNSKRYDYRHTVRSQKTQHYSSFNSKRYDYRRKQRSAF